MSKVADTYSIEIYHEGEGLIMSLKNLHAQQATTLYRTLINEYQAGYTITMLHLGVPIEKYPSQEQEGKK